MLLRRGENPSRVLDGDPRQGRRSSTPRSCRRACASSRSTTAATLVDADARHGAPQPAVRGFLLIVGVVWLFLRTLRGSLVVASSSRSSLLVGLHRAAPARPAGQPDLDGRDRLRHPRRRRRGAGRERHPRRVNVQPPKTRRELLALDRALGLRRRAADLLRDGDHHRRADPGVHAGARRGPHLPPARADLQPSRWSARWCSR